MSDQVVAIELREVWKHFNYWEEKQDNFKKLLIAALKGNFSFGKKQKISVLENISFKINKGEFVGLMGRNGVGKSTLLKVISGIYFPNRGAVNIHGKIAPLIELGAGFVGDLSGYDNIFINAAILGYMRNQTKEKIETIIEFSELGEKIHMPVKNYSSGMILRLGFSIAVMLDAPILVFDEVLGVGDVGFQNKCIQKIVELHRMGRTVVLVTHSPEQVEQYCDRCILFNEKKLVFDGDGAQGAQQYRQLFYT